VRTVSHPADRIEEWKMSGQLFQECAVADLLYLGIPGASALKCVMLSFIRGKDLLVGR